MEPEKQTKNTKVIFLAIIGVLVIVIAVLVFLLVTKDNKKETKPTSSNSTVNDSNTNTNNDNKQDDNDSKMDEETKKLMMLFPPIENAYQNKLMKVTDFEIGDIYTNTMLAIENYYSENVYYHDYDHDDDCPNGSLTFYYEPDTKLCFTKDISLKTEDEFAVDEKTFQKYFQQFYGDSIKYKRLTDTFGSTKNFTDYHYQKGYYYGYGGGGGYGFGDGAEFDSFSFNRVETKGDEKYIYVDYAYTVYHCQDEDCEKGTITYYRDSSMKEKMYEAPFVFDDSINIFDSASLASGKIPLYKHTYKKNSDGSYYWYSVEPVK